MSLLRIVALGSMVFAQSASPSLPGWLTPYPGAEWKVATASGPLTASCTADATEDQVLSHLQRVFSSAGAPFHPQANGIGTSIQAKTEKCNLMISVRESGGRTHVRVVCAAPVPSAPAALAPPPAVAASRPDAVASVPISPSSGGTAPTLAWPSWLVAMGGAGPLRPVERVSYGEARLVASYKTNASLPDIHDFYKHAAEANGYNVIRSRVTVSQTTRGNIRFSDPYGSVEACRPETGSSVGPRRCAKATFSGTGPASVQLVVWLMGGL